MAKEEGVKEISLSELEEVWKEVEKEMARELSKGRCPHCGHKRILLHWLVVDVLDLSKKPYVLTVTEDTRSFQLDRDYDKAICESCHEEIDLDILGELFYKNKFKVVWR